MAVPLTSAMQTSIANLYISILGRNPDPVGFGYWCDVYANANGTQAALDAIASGFGKSPEFTGIYSGQTVANAVALMYNNILGRTQDAAGATYWQTQATNLINSGKTIGDAYALTANAMIVAAAANTGTADATLIANKQTAAVTAGTSTPTTTYTLTTGVDTLTGGAGNDTFVGVAATTSPTFQAFDTLTGGAGTDTLNLTVSTLAANSIPTATVTGIEIINVRNVSGNAQTIALGNFVGATEIISDRSDAAMTVTGMTAGQQLTINGDGTTTNSTMANTYASTVTSATMNIRNGVTAGAITQTAAGLTTQVINSTGAANTVGAIAMSGAATVTALTINAATALTTGNITNFGGTAATITVSGAATSATTGVGVNIGTIENTTVKTIDASGLTAGGIQLTMSTNTTLVVTGGQGNDRITTGAALASGGSVNAGAGTADRLILTADTDINSTAIGGRYSNFEVVGLTAGRTLDMDNLNPTNTLTGLRLAGSGTVTNMLAAQAANVVILADSTPSLGVKGATTVGQIDTVNLTVTDEATAVVTITVTTPVLTGVEKLNLNAVDNATITAMTSAASVDTFTITGSGNTNITTGAVATVLNSAVNASASTGTFTYTAAATTGANGMSIIGSATKVNTITGTANGDVITGGSAADSLTNQTTGVAASAGDIITGGAGFDTFSLYGSTASGAVSTIYTTTARIADFTVGTTTTTTDFLSLSATQGNYGAAVAFNATVAAAAAGSTVIQTVQQSNGAAAITAGADMIKLSTGVAVTGTLAAAFDAAIGTSTVTGLTATSAIYFSLYDTTNSRMVVGIVDTTAGVNTVVQSGDTVVLVGTMNMSAADYANFSNASLVIVA